MTADELEAAAHDKIAEGHALLAQARRARVALASAQNDWLAPGTSPLGKRRELSLARAGAIESSKVGKKVLIKRASLAAYLESHARGVEPEEDLFGRA